MASAEILKQLGFERSPNFLRAGDTAMESAPAYGHIFRRATGEPGLIGVYTLRSSEATANTPSVPVLYVCRVESEHEADRSHQLVWNQDVVPFVLVETSRGYRLYSGFEYERRPAQSARNLLRVFNSATEAAESGFHADAIDDGTLWRRWGRKIRPEARVDWTLLDNLRTLDRWLRANDLSPAVSHALIGKYVYLHYLRDRGILSDRKLEAWRIPKEGIFGRDATVAGLNAAVERLDEWLNGGVFPLSLRGADAPRDEHVRQVAATFAGDKPSERGDWQLHLDFKAYDFSYIPIETLSVVYEQFLHVPLGEGRSRGREAGAYYTPIPVVNFMLAEIEDQRPLERGVRVLDPSCGSGAFLVQCYRRLVEKEYPPGDAPPGPVQLRKLLQQSIFGVDRDGDACSVTELSLVLTLLDYCTPPDLEDNRSFKLPSLRGENIVCENFFRTNPDCFTLLGRRKFDWVVGNPPWKGLNPKKLSDDDKPVWAWMEGQEERGTPVGDHEVAQAFAWEAGRYVAADGVVAFLMPAMSLFEEPSTDFRRAFFRTFRMISAANFSNLTEVLFAGRSRDPAAAFFYRPRSKAEPGNEHLSVYSPMVANQEATRPVGEGRRTETWSLVLNASEVRQVAFRDVSSGSQLPWKLAIWGSHLDLHLLQKVQARFKTMGDLEDSGALLLARAPELLEAETGASTYRGEYCEEVVGKNALDVKVLEGMRRIFAFPSKAIKPNTKAYLRRRGGKRGLLVCRPPHIVVSEARNFAVYTEDYLVLPPGQIGVASTQADRTLLKAVTLFLNSDFALYFQFLTSRLGVKRPVASLASLRELPTPLLELSPDRLDAWAELHDRLVTASRLAFSSDNHSASLFDGEPVRGTEIKQLLEELNATVFEALGFKTRERALVEDLVHVRLELDDGKLGRPAVDPPKAAHLKRYAKRLKAELDAFVGEELPKRYDVDVIHDDQSGMVQVTFVRENEPHGAEVYEADDETAAELKRTRARLRRRHAQWVYFDRNLQVFEGRRAYVLKPMQRFHWTESQAMFDAAEIISRTLAGTGAAR